MKPLDHFLEQAWKDHADDAAAVAARLAEGLEVVQDDDGVTRLAALSHHVLGEHLRHGQEGLAFLASLLERRLPGTNGAAAIARCRASLLLSGGLADERETMTASDQCRVSAMAACNLAGSDVARASQLLQEAVARAGALPDDDPGVRILAGQGNGIAATLRDGAPTGSGFARVDDSRRTGSPRAVGEGWDVARS